jgi:hypothetical protein
MKHMNHISPEMTQLYNRNDKLNKSAVNGLKILKHIANNEGLLELNPENVDNQLLKMDLSDDIKRKDYEILNEFLKINNFNIVQDLEKLIKLISKGNSPIFENEFGVCVKAAIHGICERQHEPSPVMWTD